MKVFSTISILGAALAARLATADTPPPAGGKIGACHDQGCDNCAPSGSSANEGYPQCLIYNSASKLGQSFAAANGNGYDVWWNSGPPNPSCRIVVRTPATTDLPACGYYLTSWNQAGCYYTAIQHSFMLQYCCGQGDCDAASPASSVKEAHERLLEGNTTIVSLSLDDMGSAGKRTIEGIGEMTWKRSDHAYSRREETAEADAAEDAAMEDIAIEDATLRGSCAFHPRGDRTSVGGRQVKASDTQVCNTQGGCSLSASVTITEGETISPNIGANFFSTISASVGYSFMKSKAYAVSTTYNQKQGTTGSMTFIPTLYCWDGTFSDCAYEHGGGNIHRIDPNKVFHACTPALRAGGQLDGTFSFAYQ